MTAITGVGIDFGTTNSVLAFAYADGRVESRVWPSQDGMTSTFRTALTFWREGREVRHVAGPAAVERAISPEGEQRFVQSLKTHLASRAFSETRLYGRRFTIEELIALFLGELLAGGAPIAAQCHVAAGRPVVFAGQTADEDLAVARLHAAYAATGLPQAALAFEPLGAAYWYARGLKRDETVLVADFGGGTSDFSVLRFTHGADGLVAEPLAHTGVGVAGDTFDSRLVEHVVAPRFGKGATYKSFDKILPIPAYIHAAFSQWHQLSWLKSGTILADLRKLAETSARGAELEDLATLVELDLGLVLYRAVAAAKADLSAKTSTRLAFTGFDLTFEAEIARADFERWIANDVAAIEGAMDEALATARLAPGGIDAVFMTGGTSFVPAVRRLFTDRFAPDKVHQGDAFQSVASGLALLAADRARAGSLAAAI